MKKYIFLFLVFALMCITDVKAQGLLVGDMNEDDRLSVSDVTTLVYMVAGKIPERRILSTSVDNSTLVGTWINGSLSITFGEDGTTDYGSDYTYAFLPMESRIILFNAGGTVVGELFLVWRADNYIVLRPSNSYEYTYYYKGDFVNGITLSQSAIAGEVGLQYQLTAVVTPPTAAISTIVWSSSDTEVATVDENGLVTIVGGGSATITATAKDGTGISASCSVNVPRLVSDIALSQTNVYLPLDGTLTLTATVSPETAFNRSVTWTSSNSEIVFVSKNGRLMAVDYGESTITCTAQDGSGVSATCVVKVVDLISSITLSETSLSLAVGENHTLVSTILPAGAGCNPCLWSSSDTDVAIVDADGVVTSVAEGSATITCSAQDGSNVSATCVVNVQNTNVQSWTAPELPTRGSEVVSGQQYLVKNIGASEANSQGMFLSGGSSWYSWAASTVLTTEENALVFTLTETEKGWSFAREGDGKFTFISAASPVGNDGWGEMHVDQGSQSENLRYFNLLKQEGNVYRIQASRANSTYYDANKFWGWCVDEQHRYPNAVYATVSTEGFAVDWEFISITTYHARVDLYNALVESEKYSNINASNAAAIYNNADATPSQLQQATTELLTIIKEAALSQASEENPLDVTEWLNNPSFDTSISGWEIDMPNNKAGGGGYQTIGKYHNEEANAHCDNFIECWIAKNTTGLRNGHIQQTISDMPQGKYRLTVDCIAVQQAGQSHTGVQLFCTDSEIDTYQEIATQDGKPETFQIDFVNSGGDLTFGLRCIDTNANWIAVDNFHLYYMGKVIDSTK